MLVFTIGDRGRRDAVVIPPRSVRLVHSRALLRWLWRRGLLLLLAIQGERVSLPLRRLVGSRRRGGLQRLMGRLRGGWIAVRRWWWRWRRGRRIRGVAAVMLRGRGRVFALTGDTGCRIVRGSSRLVIRLSRPVALLPRVGMAVVRGRRCSLLHLPLLHLPLFHLSCVFALMHGVRSIRVSAGERALSPLAVAEFRLPVVALAFLSFALEPISLRWWHVSMIFVLRDSDGSLGIVFLGMAHVFPVAVHIAWGRPSNLAMPEGAGARVGFRLAARPRGDGIARDPPVLSRLVGSRQGRWSLLVRLRCPVSWNLGCGREDALGRSCRARSRVASVV